MITVYGIPNCNTVKKAMDWLRANHIDFTFHDYKKKGITADQLQQWSDAVGFEKLLNTKGTTWRGLTAEEITAAVAEAGALQLMQEKTSLIKRPVIEQNGKVVAVGFDEPAYQQVLIV